MVKTEDINYTEIQKEQEIHLASQRYILQFIKEYIPSISILITLVFTIGGAIVRFLIYLSTLGYAQYFKIPKEYIDISSNNLIYDLMVYGVWALLLVILNYIPFLLWKSNIELHKKIIATVVGIIGIPLAIVIFVLLYDSLKSGLVHTFAEVFKFFVLVFTSILLVFILGVAYGILFYVIKKADQEKNQHNNTKKMSSVKKWTDSKNANVIIILIILSILIVYLGFVYIQGRNNASKIDSFIIIEQQDHVEIQNTYAVIYKTPQKLVLTPCVIDEKSQTISFIDLNHQQIIDNANIEYSIKQLRQK